MSQFQKILSLVTITGIFIVLFQTTVVESGLFFKGCGESPGVFKLAQRYEVPTLVMETIQESGNGLKARCKIPFNVMCLPATAECEYDNQCCTGNCQDAKCQKA